MDQELAEGYQWQFRKHKSTSKGSVSLFFWFIWTYSRNTATLKGDPFPATNVVMYGKTLIFYVQGN